MRRRYHSRLPEIDWPYLLAPTLAARPDRRVPSTGMGPARHHRVSNGRSNVMERLFAELRRHADERPDHAALVDASHVITYRELWPALQLAAATMRSSAISSTMPGSTASSPTSRCESRNWSAPLTAASLRWPDDRSPATLFGPCTYRRCRRPPPNSPTRPERLATPKACASPPRTSRASPSPS